MLSAQEILSGPKLAPRRLWKGEAEIVHYLETCSPGTWVSANWLKANFGGRDETARNLVEARDDFERAWNPVRRAWGWSKSDRI